MGLGLGGAVRGGVRGGGCWGPGSGLQGRLQGTGLFTFSRCKSWITSSQPFTLHPTFEP